MAFDNRGLVSTPKLWLRTLRSPDYTGPLHFSFEVEGRRIVYAYIRKNACTSFKRYLLDRARITEMPKGNEAIRILSNMYRSQYRRDFVGADRTVFVHRDPVDRAISLYKNKFIQGKGAIDIHRDYEGVVGESPDDATFQTFVLRYLPSARDPHTRSQRSHLYPSVYTDAIPIESLSDAAHEVLSPEVADTYFARPTNVSGSQTYENPDAPTISARELRTELRRTGLYPSNQSLAPQGGAIHRALLIKYEDDIVFRRQ